MALFDEPADYQAFEKVIEQTVERTGIRLLCYCLMPNHWHLVVWPRKHGELSDVMRWLTVTHTQRWHAAPRNGRHGARLPGTVQVVSGSIRRSLLGGRPLCRAQARRGRASWPARRIGDGRVCGVADTAMSCPPSS